MSTTTAAGTETGVTRAEYCVITSPTCSGGTAR
jgi:hypothetical protein